MTARRTARILFSAAALTLAATILAGCTGEPGAATSGAPDAPGTQSIADACTAVRDTVTDAVDRLGAVDVADPAASVVALREVADRLGTAAATVDNADLDAVLPDLQRGFEAAGTAVQGLAGGDPAQLPALQRATGDIQSAFARFSALCSPR